MKKFAIRSCSLIMALVLAIGLCISASATEFAPYASDYLSKYQGTVTAQGNERRKQLDSCKNVQ